MFEVWTRDYPEETTRVYSSTDKKKCEYYMQLHVLDHQEGFIIVEVKSEKEPLSTTDVIISGCCFIDTWDIEKDGLQEEQFYNTWNKYREIDIKNTYNSLKELYEDRVYCSDQENPHFENGKDFEIIKERFPGEFEWFLKIPVTTIQELFRNTTSKNPHESVFIKLKEIVTDRVREEFEKYFEEIVNND